MRYDEIKELFRKSSDEEYKYLCIDRSKARDQGRFCICNESKNIYFDCTPDSSPFSKLITLIHTSTLMCNSKISFPWFTHIEV